ncbi:MAG: DUF2304 domain-containing protein [Patescibacteria group bacterium]
MVIQIILTVCSFLVIVRAVKSFRKGAIRFPMFVFWSLFWLTLVFFLWQPGLADRIAWFLQVGRGADAVFYLALVLIFGLIFKIMVRLESLDSQLTTIVRELAIIQKNPPSSPPIQ